LMCKNNRRWDDAARKATGLFMLLIGLHEI
jgi:hypothetical protein